ncbi:MAG: molecular chaperone TorD family protein [Nitrospirota bacterium]
MSEVKEKEESQEEKDDRVAHLAARSKVYEVLARAFRYPWDTNYFNPEDMLESLSMILPDDHDWERVQGLIASVSEALSATDKEGLQREHMLIFTHGFSKECPPYEIFYGTDGYTQQIDVLMELGGIYKRYGVELSDRADERPDHLSIELEFMQYLTYKEAYGIQHGHPAEATKVASDGQKKFILNHLGRWVPLFCQFLSQKAAKGLYLHLAGILSIFMTNEVRLLGVRPKLTEAPDFHPIPYPYEDSIVEEKGSCYVGGADAVKALKKEMKK